MPCFVYYYMKSHPRMSNQPKLNNQNSTTKLRCIRPIIDHDSSLWSIMDKSGLSIKNKQITNLIKRWFQLVIIHMQVGLDLKFPALG